MGALTNFFATVLNSLHTLTGSYGWSIILFAGLVKLALYLPTQQQYRSMKEMQQKMSVIQPDLKRIHEKYKDDPERLQKEQTALFQKHNYNPVSGCLPMLLQMPILWGIYAAVRKIFMPAAGTVAPNFHENFLWIGTPLSHQFPKILATSWDKPDIVLIVCYAITMMISQKLSTSAPAADPAQAQTQKMMSNVMPIMFAFFLWRLPSALVLYWLMFNILSMFQQVHILREQNVSPGRKAQEEPVPIEDEAKSQKGVNR
ncbi:MAG: YidC/Oxa1 family membrane protein insertase [Candidatus Xenobia bacterium]